MFLDLDKYDIYIKPGITDMRKRAESLSFLVRSDMKLNPRSKSVFLFCGRGKRRVVAIVWDDNGYLEISKKLECGMSYKWPNSKAEALAVTKGDIEEMLRGGDPWRRFPTYENDSLI